MNQTVTNWPQDHRPESCPVYTFNQLTIGSPIDVVWAWLIKAELWPTWYANSQRLIFDQGNGPDLALGTRFTWTTFHVRVTTVVEEFVPPHRLAWSGKGMGAAGYHAWFLEGGTNGCRVVTEETQRGVIPSLGRVFLKRGLLHHHQRWLEGLEKMSKTGFPPNSK